MILDLSLSLLERLGLIIIFAFFMSKTSLFKNYLNLSDHKVTKNLFFAVLWGGIGILMTLLGTPYDGCIVNSRTIPIVLSGIFGGPVVGLVSGMIAGFHRAFLTNSGDITAYACGVSTILAGLLGGFYKIVFNQNNRKSIHGLFLGLIAEAMQMGVVLLFAKPFSEAWELVKVIFFPMTILNALGVFIFLLVIEQLYEDNENAAATKAEISLNIANKTLHYLKKGLNIESAKMTTEIIFNITGFSAVSITDKERILSHVGLGDDHHKEGEEIRTEITKRVIKREKMEFSYKSNEIGCSYDKCPLKSVVAIPLTVFGETIGTLKIYSGKGQGIKKSDIELIKGLGILFSSQLELGKLEHQKSLREEAELSALRAQIKPHFLFNSLNTIMSLIRTDGEEARVLLHELSLIIRNSFKENKLFVNLSEEIRLIEAYLNIEKARFSDKLNIEFDIDRELETLISPLIIQPLVENAVKHGIRHKETPGTVILKICKTDGKLQVIVKDDGVGIDFNNENSLESSNGIGLKNVRERLKSIYNTDVKIESEKHQGTTISFLIPMYNDLY